MQSFLISADFTQHMKLAHDMISMLAYLCICPKGYDDLNLNMMTSWIQ